MKIAIGCDHGGINLKPILTAYLDKKYIEYEDFGCMTNQSVDYNDYAEKVAEAVANGKCDLGILICGTGIGMSIAANKVKGIRCGHCHDVFSAKMTRLHNDANILALPGRFISNEMAWDIVKAYLTTDFEGGRHLNRIKKIDL